jgi:hypothetical protein
MIFPTHLPSSKTRIITVALVAAFFILSSVFYIYRMHINSSQSSQKQHSASMLKGASGSGGAIESSFTQSANPYQNWRSYSTAKPYQFKFPQGWFKDSELGIPSIDDSAVVASENIKLPGEVSGDNMYVSISVTSQPVGRDQLVLDSPVGRIIKGQYDNTYDILTKLGTKKLDGYDATYFTEDFSADSGVNGGYEYVYLIQNGGKYYQISFDTNNAAAFSKQKSNVSNILSSFIFNS